MSVPELPPHYYVVLQVSNSATDEEIRRSYKELAKVLHPDKNPHDPNATSAFQLPQEAYETLSDPLKRQSYDTAYRHILYQQACFERQSRHAERQAARDSDVFDPEYEHRKHREGMCRFSRSPKKPPPTAFEFERKARQEKEWRRQLKRDEKSWEKAARTYAKTEKEKVSERMKREGPIAEWLEGVVEVEGYVNDVEPVVREEEWLIDFEEDLIIFDHPEETIRPDQSARPDECLKPDEFARPGERLRKRGSLGSHGRKASNEARSEWAVFFDRFETLKV